MDQQWNVDKIKLNNMRKFKHTAFDVLMSTLAIGTAGYILFALSVVIKTTLNLWEIIKLHLKNSASALAYTSKYGMTTATMSEYMKEMY